MITQRTHELLGDTASNIDISKVKEKEQLLAVKVAEAVKILYESVRDRKIRQIMDELKNNNK